MKKLFLVILVSISLLAFGTNGFSSSNLPSIIPQGKIIPFDSKDWEINNAAKVEDYSGLKVLNVGIKKPGQKRPMSLGVAKLKNTSFSQGIIEYDIMFKKTRLYVGLRFHAQPDQSYESFYMRAHQTGNPDANQYLPEYNSIASWQLYYGKPFSKQINYKFDQ